MSYFDNNMSGLLGGGQPYAQPIDAMSGINGAMQQNAAQPKKRSFFDKLGNALGNDDAQMHFAAAAAYAKGDVETAAQILAHSQSLKQAEAEYERKRHDDMADWQTKEQWERDNPKPINNDTAQDWAFYQQNLSPEEFAKWKTNHIVDPIRYVPLGNGQVMAMGGYQAPQSSAPPVLTDADIAKMSGGAPQPGARPFPY